MQIEALRRVPSALSCETDDDCVVFRAEIECANVSVGDCGTLLTRAVQRDLDWDRTQRQICEAVEGTDFGCAVSVSCVGYGPPHCERGTCVRETL